MLFGQHARILIVDIAPCDGPDKRSRALSTLLLTANSFNQNYARLGVAGLIIQLRRRPWATR